jgi:hypothetical protein
MHGAILGNSRITVEEAKAKDKLMKDDYKSKGKKKKSMK